MERRRYLVVVEAAPDGGYGVYAPDVAGCIGLGRTVREALASFQESLTLWIEETVADGGQVPAAHSQAAFAEVELGAEGAPRVWAHVASVVPVITDHVQAPGTQRQALTPDGLRDVREHLRLSQSALARRLGIHPNTLAKWERGEQAIQHPAMVTLALAALAQQSELRPGIIEGSMSTGGVL